MFNFFKRDHLYYLNRGDKYLQEERFAEARHAFQEALQKLEGSGAADQESEITRKMAEAGNRLGALNLREATHAVNRGDTIKAEEHLKLVMELAEDPSLRNEANGLLASLRAPGEPALEPPVHKGSCAGSSCSSGERHGAEPGSSHDNHLSPLERFELMMQTLPGGLGARYAALGDEFAEGYMLIHHGDEVAGARVLHQLVEREENDIVLYELALVKYRQGDAADCEKFLRRALVLESGNPLCHLSLAQLFADSGRFTEALPVLQNMIDHQMLIEQALLLSGDIHQRLGNVEEAVKIYGTALNHPVAARGAAERLMPLLVSAGRMEEGAFIAKKYLKGCC